MVSSSKTKFRTGGSYPSAWNGVSSVLRLAANDRRHAASRGGWWSGLARLLRSAGSNPHARPLHAVLAGGDFTSSSFNSR